ncbi:MAG: PrsW family intramembrane metalloprotease, partial [Bacteroidales bacterium]|nr:PrsW family intramembrane metalloprotease [Bacteroidales bacterium]
MAISTILTYLQAPLLALLFVLYIKQKFQLKTTKHLFQAYGFGLLSIVVFIAIDFVISLLGLDALKSLKRSVFYSFVVIGFGSQVGIFAVLRYVFLRKRHFKGPIDGIIYAIIIALGFSTLAVPLFEAGLFAKVPAPLFLYTLPWAALFFAIVMGFFTGMGKFRKNKMIDSLTGIGTSSFFMGFYYFAFLTKEDTI